MTGPTGSAASTTPIAKAPGAFCRISTSAITAAPRSMASVTSTVNTVLPRRGRRSRSGGTVAGGTHGPGGIGWRQPFQPVRGPLPDGVGAGAAGGADRAGPPAQVRSSCVSPVTGQA